MGIASTTMMTATPSPAFFEDQVEFDISVTGGGPTPTGNVILTDSLDPGGNFGGPYTLPLDGSGNAVFMTNQMNPGNHDITAAYQGDGTYDPSSHQLTEQVVEVSEPQSIIPGFSLIATFSTSGDDTLTPTASLAIIPVSASAHTSLTLLWTVLNVPKIQITASVGTPFPGPSNQSEIITTAGTGAYILGNGVAVTTVFTLHALDAGGAPLGGLIATATATVV